MKTRFYNARILPSADENIIIGELHVNGNLIEYVGENIKADEKFDREINCGGNLLIPGFKDAHAHSAMVFLRSLADDLPLQEWLFDQVFPREDKLTPDDIYILTKLAILEYLSGGITSCFDMYFFPDAIAAAGQDCGFRTVLCGTTAERIHDEFTKYNGKNELTTYILGFHAEYTSSLEQMKIVAEAANEYKTPVYCHNSETLKETEECKARYGKTPTALFEELGIFNYGGGGFHCIYLDDTDIEIFKRRNLWAVTNPASNTKLASGIAPICKMQEKGVNLAIGTDGAASNNCLDMFREMFLATGLQKLLTKDASACSADSVLKMAFSGSALAMGLNDCDSLKKGKKADLVMIDLQQPNMQPINNIVKNLVYSGSKSNVKLTMINGKILYENGEYFIGELPEEIYRKSAKVLEHLI